MPIGMDFMAPVTANQEYQQREQAAPAELAQKAASTRYTTALADRVESETKADKAVSAQLAQMAGAPSQAGGDGSISSKLNSMSDMYAKAGQPAKAAQLAQQASQAAAHEATARAAAVRSAAEQTKLQGEQFKQASQLLSGVKDQDSWDAANGTFEKMTGQPSPFKDIPYDPKVVEALSNASMTAYQKQQLKLRATAVSAQLTNVASEIGSRATRDTVALERLRVEQQRADRLAKSGGKDIGAPAKLEISAADKLLGDTGLEGDERDAAAFSIASEARVIRRKNPGVSADEALRQAAAAAKSNGSIIPGQKNLLSRNVPAKFSPPTGVKSLPASADKLVTGHVYSDGKGNIAEWDGKGWTNKRKAEAPAAKAGPSSGSSDGEDPGDDDDE